MDIDANPYVTAVQAKLIEALIPDRRERGIWAQSARNLLAADDALLAASVAHATVGVFAELVGYLLARGQTIPLDDQLQAAEGIVHIALSIRSAGEPKLPKRQ